MKWIRGFLTAALLLIFATGAWAAGTIVVANNKKTTDQTGGIREISYTVTFGADASSPANVALDSILKSNGITAASLGGWWLLRVDVYYGSTGPTDNTDMYLYKGTGANKADLLGDNGADKIDNATNTAFYPATVSQPLLGDEIISFANNAVNDATCTLIFTLYK